MARIAIVGAGMVGAAVAAALQESGGHSLVLCERRPRPKPLVLIGQVQVPVHAAQVSVPDEASQADFVILAVKSHQVSGAGEWLSRLCAPSTTVVVLQNGVEHAQHVEPFVGPAVVLPGIVWIAGATAQPRTISVRGIARLVVPESASGRAFAELLDVDWLTVELTADFTTEAWRKLCVNVMAGLEPLVGRGSSIFRREDLRNLAMRLARECVEVGRAEGAHLELSFAEEAVGYLADLDPEVEASILLDRRANRPLEWDAVNGAVRRLAMRHGIATPVSDVIVPLLAAASPQPGGRGRRS